MQEILSKRFHRKFYWPNETHREKLYLTYFSTAMAAWLFLNFFIYLHNQLSSIYSIHVLRVQMLEKCDSSNKK